MTPHRPGPSSEVFQAAYAELRRLAQVLLSSERPDHTLQATALVHESWVKLADQTRAQFESQGHFMAIAAQAMRRILVDHARGKGAARRGGAWGRVTLNEELVGQNMAVDVLCVDAGLVELESLDPRTAQIVEMRFFGGLSEEEIARILKVSRSTVTREWRLARALLAQRLEDDQQ